MARAPAEYRAVLEEHRQRLTRLVERRGGAVIKKLYTEAQDELTRKLAALSGGVQDTMTAHQMRVMLAQVKVVEGVAAKDMTAALAVASRETQVESLRATIKDITRLEKKFTGAAITVPVEEAARFRGVIDKRRTSLMSAHKSSMANYGASIVSKVEKELSLSLMTGETHSAAIDRVVKVTGGEWWQGERIVRTELAWANNATAADGIAESAKELPDMMLRWSEHVDDSTYAILDDRVGVDSIAMHGQLAKPGGTFVMPPTAPAPDADGNTAVPKGMIGERWSFPPNRPNDRAVIAPWRPGWGVPGWLWKSGMRVPRS